MYTTYATRYVKYERKFFFQKLYFKKWKGWYTHGILNWEMVLWPTIVDLRLYGSVKIKPRNVSHLLVWIGFVFNWLGFIFLFDFMAFLTLRRLYKKFICWQGCIVKRKKICWRQNIGWRKMIFFLKFLFSSTVGLFEAAS